MGKLVNGQRWLEERLFQEATGFLVRLEQTLHQGPQRRILSARAVQVGGSFGRRFLLHRGLEDFFCCHRFRLPWRGVSPSTYSVRRRGPARSSFGERFLEWPIQAPRRPS